MATRGYPRTRFEIIDQTQIPDLPVTTVYNNIPIAMATFTSDKGPENWRMYRSFAEYINLCGGINFERHGQAQLTVAEVLRNGGYVFGKRLISSDANLANITIRARVVETDGISYLYTYAITANNCKNINDAAEVGYNNYDFNDTTATDFPLFTIAAKGRGESSLFFRLNPEHSSSRSHTSMRYTVEAIDSGEVIDRVVVSLNPDFFVDNVNQNIESKINSDSTQFSCKLFEDGMYGLVRKLVETATFNGSALTVEDLMMHDFINGLNYRGNIALGGIVCSAASDNSSDEWTSNLPTDIGSPYNLSDAIGVPLANGSYGTLGAAPMEQQGELTNLLLGAWGKNTDSEQFDPIIYDLDAYKPDGIFDCAYPLAVKNAIIDVADYRNDVMFFADEGMEYTTLEDIVSMAGDITNSRCRALYHNWFKIRNPYTRKFITVTMPLLLASRFVAHVNGGSGRPFAGITNGFTFPEIIDGTVNFMPVVIPGVDQKQVLADNCINYINYYDGVAVMETMYNGNEDYTQLNFVHNMLAIQEVIKAVRSNCPKVRYTFLDGDDLQRYIEDARAVLNRFATNFKSIDIEYAADEVYEANNIFYAVITVQFHNFIQEEYFKVIAIN